MSNFGWLVSSVIGVFLVLCFSITNSVPITTLPAQVPAQAPANSSSIASTLSASERYNKTLLNPELLPFLAECKLDDSACNAYLNGVRLLAKSDSQSYLTDSSVQALLKSNAITIEFCTAFERNLTELSNTHQSLDAFAKSMVDPVRCIRRCTYENVVSKELSVRPICQMIIPIYAELTNNPGDLGKAADGVKISETVYSDVEKKASSDSIVASPPKTKEATPKSSVPSSISVAPEITKNVIQNPVVAKDIDMLKPSAAALTPPPAALKTPAALPLSEIKPKQEEVANLPVKSTSQAQAPVKSTTKKPETSTDNLQNIANEPSDADFKEQDEDDGDDDMFAGESHPGDRIDTEKHNLHKDPFVSEEDSSFFSYFLLLLVLIVAAYVAFHNRRVVLAMLLEGRRRGGSSDGSGRRKHTAAYRKLDSNLEEAIASPKGGTTRTQPIIY